jgi:magnesium chelatase family protein
MRVTQTRIRQLQRQQCLNSRLKNHQNDLYCAIDASSEKILMTAIDKLKLTARSYHKLHKLVRTIADTPI